MPPSSEYPHDAEKAETEKSHSFADLEDKQPRRPAQGGLRKSFSKTPGWEGKDPFDQGEDDGAEAGKAIDYKSMKWWQAGMVMIAETISLGILSLPSVLDKIGMVPGVILIAGLGLLATYTGFVLWQFRMKYPWVHSFGDAGEILFKPLGCPKFGRELFGGAQTIFLIFTMGSHILTWTICLNTITDSATCTIVWSIIGLIIFWLCDLPRTLKKVSYMSIASFISIFSAVLITMIDVGIEPPIGTGSIAATKSVGFTKAFVSVSNIIFAYAGHSCFFGFMAEFKRPEDFPKALILLQICDTSMYLVVAIVIYRYCGDNLKSPALGSAGPVVKKVAWGIAIPTIIIAGVIYGHVASKYIFVRLFRGTKHVNRRTKVSTVSWWVITMTAWVIAWIIAESIPNFNDLLALISSLFASWFTYGLSGVFWLFLNYGQWFSRPSKILLTLLNFTLFGIGLAICALGLWSAGDAIHNDAGASSWTCASNGQ